MKASMPRLKQRLSVQVGAARSGKQVIASISMPTDPGLPLATTSLITPNHRHRVDISCLAANHSRWLAGAEGGMSNAGGCLFPSDQLPRCLRPGRELDGWLDRQPRQLSSLAAGTPHQHGRRVGLPARRFLCSGIANVGACGNSTIFPSPGGSKVPAGRMRVRDMCGVRARAEPSSGTSCHLLSQKGLPSGRHREKGQGECNASTRSRATKNPGRSRDFSLRRATWATRRMKRCAASYDSHPHCSPSFCSFSHVCSGAK